MGTVEAPHRPTWLRGIDPHIYRLPAYLLAAGQEVWHEGAWRRATTDAEPAGRTRVRLHLARVGAIVLRREAPVAVRD